jgi:hypothetical protein
MSVFETGRRPLRDANVRSRAAGRLRHAALALAAAGLATGSGLLTAGSALASTGLQPGNLIFTPTAGADTATPSWRTTDGCPVGYRQSAQVAIFSTKGDFLSRISPAVSTGLTGPFSGTLDGSLSSILRYAQVKPGGQLLFVVGCYSMVGGTGNVQWQQSEAIKLAASGTAFSSTSDFSGTPSVVRGAGVAGTGRSTSGSGQSEAVNVASTSGPSGATVAFIAAACCLLLAIAVAVWIRRRNRSQLS